MTVYQLCPSCSVAAANADTSHLAPEDERRVTAWLEAAGLIVHIGTGDEPGYWSCNCCGWEQIGDQPELWEAV